MVNLPRKKRWNVFNDEQRWLQFERNVSNDRHQQISFVLRACLRVVVTSFSRTCRTHTLTWRARTKQSRASIPGLSSIFLYYRFPRLAEISRHAFGARMIQQADFQTFWVQFRHHVKLKSCAPITNVASPTVGKQADCTQLAHDAFPCRFSLPKSWTSRNCSCTFLARVRKSRHDTRFTRPSFSNA